MIANQPEATPAIKNTERIFGLDLMRFLAISMVLVGHCAWIFPENKLVTPLLALSGYMGVEFFFVLSGFLIGRILYRHFMEEHFTLQTVIYFLKRRWLRTLPNYFLILLVNILIASAIGYEIEGLWRYFVFLQNFAAPLLPFFTESWSLSVEEFAYLLLPMVLLAAAVIFGVKNKSRLFFLNTLLLIFVFVATKCVYHFNSRNSDIGVWNIAVKSVVVFRLDSIFIGVLFSWMYSNYQNFWIKTKFILAVFGLFFMVFFAVGVGYSGLFIHRYPFFWNVVYLPMTSIGVAFFLPLLSDWKQENAIFRKPVVFISLISYSIYLLHYGVVLQTMKQFVDTKSLDFTRLSVFTLLYLSMTVFLSYLLYRFFEKPIMDKRQLI